MHIVLVSTFGISLEHWERVGILDRELKPYQRLARKGLRISFLTYGGKKDIEIAAKYPAITFLTKPPYMPNLVFSILAPFIYLRLFRTADIFKTNQIYGWWTAYISAKLTGKPFLLRCGFILSLNYERKHGSTLITKIIKFQERIAFRQANHIIVTTQAMKDFLLQFYHVLEEMVSVVPNSVDVTQFTPAMQELHSVKTRICFVGSMKQAKNPLELLEAFSLVQVPEVHLTMIGGGVLRPQIEAKIQKEKLNVELLGAVPNQELPDIMRSCALFVMASLWEGHPKALIEAMSCGLPVVAYDSPGINSIIKHNINGLLSACNPNSLASTLTNALIDECLRNRIGRAARQYVLEHYSLETVTALEEEIYSQILASRIRCMTI